MPTKYTHKDFFYPDGRPHSEWHIFEVVVVPKDTGDNLIEREKAKQSYWVSADSEDRSYTLYQDLIKYGYIVFNKEKDVSVNLMFEKTYKKILLKYVGDEKEKYPVEVNFKSLMLFINRERGLL